MALIRNSNWPTFRGSLLWVERRMEKEKKDDNYTRREFGCVSFSRTFNLPENTNEVDISAKYEEGILRLSIGKKNLPESRLRKAIDIK